MKSVSGGLLSHNQGDLATLATCWKITRVSSDTGAEIDSPLGFTTHVEDLTIDGVVYKASIGSYSRSMIRSSSDLAVDNVDLQAIIDDDGITEADLLNGLYDFANVEIFEVNFNDLSLGRLKLMRGTLGQVEPQGGVFQVELRGFKERLQHQIGRIYSKRCDADLGDSRCGISLPGITISGSASAVASRRQFTTATPPARAGGKLTWTSGLNNGLSMEVQNVSGGVITLFLPMPYDIVVSDTFTVYPGCDKNLSTCRDTFSNVVNFRGYPYIPGVDRALRYPDAK